MKRVSDEWLEQAVKMQYIGDTGYALAELLERRKADKENKRKCKRQKRGIMTNEEQKKR